jgi:hypothetical protein
MGVEALLMKMFFTFQATINQILLILFKGFIALKALFNFKLLRIELAIFLSLLILSVLFLANYAKKFIIIMWQRF